MYSLQARKFSSHKRTIPFLAIFAAFLLMLSASNITAQADSSAEAFVKRVGTSVLNVMSSSASDSAKQAKFRSLFVNNADTRRIGTFALGKYARNIGGQRGEYDRVLKDYVVKVYFGHLKGYKGKGINIQKSLNRGREVIVKTVFTFTNRQDVPIQWRLINSGGGYKVFDINVAGVWLAIEQRSAFNSVISQNGGKVSTIIDFMKKQIAKAG